ncbi:MAG: hypothetical protein JWR12_2244 [Mucilaginibacter sp.]|nr:hypothetical protein [Mucilaginibacter sp.]
MEQTSTFFNAFSSVSINLISLLTGYIFIKITCDNYKPLSNNPIKANAVTY